jgi:hypothetical protein
VLELTQCIDSAGIAGQFSVRALLYQGWDEKLRVKTRFFGAASLTNRVLAFLAGHPGARAFRGRGEWLAALGGMLLPANISLARALCSASLVSGSWDARIVAMEQRMVQNFLATTQSYREKRRMIAEMNFLLNLRGPLVSRCENAAVRCYAGILDGVREQLGLPLDYSLQQHREKIGLGVISALDSQIQSSDLSVGEPKL